MQRHSLATIIDYFDMDAYMVVITVVSLEEGEGFNSTGSRGFSVWSLHVLLASFYYLQTYIWGLA